MRLLLALLLALLPMPAWADVTARYASGKDTVVVEIRDNGDARIDAGGKFGIIRRGGVEYALINAPNGEIKVVKLAELVVLMAGVRGAEPTPDALKTEETFVLIAKGNAIVAGHAGTIWAFGPEKERDGRAGKLLEFVMSPDPLLQPVGALFRRVIEVAKPLLAIMVPEAGSFYPLALELAAKGAPLRISKAELRSVDSAAIDPKRFELPGPVVPAMEFLTALGAG